MGEIAVLKIGQQAADGEGAVIRPGGILYAWKFGPYRGYTKIGELVTFDQPKNEGITNGNALTYQRLTIHPDGSFVLDGTTLRISENPVGAWYLSGSCLYHILRTEYSSTTQGVAYYNYYVSEMYRNLPPGIDAEGIVFSRFSALPEMYKKPGKEYESLGALNATPII